MQRPLSAAANLADIALWTESQNATASIRPERTSSNFCSRNDTSAQPPCECATKKTGLVEFSRISVHAALISESLFWSSRTPQPKLLARRTKGMQLPESMPSLRQRSGVDQRPGCASAPGTITSTGDSCGSRREAISSESWQSLPPLGRRGCRPRPTISAATLCSTARNSSFRSIAAIAEGRGEKPHFMQLQIGTDCKPRT
mmetsp:Transcript_15052/g.26778  ORF Transcript_15052/g.26778 Transcript_15052/m.26778 type:complete len:201 (+) Transcript_15052:202-804(+)